MKNQTGSKNANLRLWKDSMLPGGLTMLPLAIAVIPWGMLCGTLCIGAGFTSFQAQLMSLLLFAGAAQIAGIAILGAGGSWLTLFNSTGMISLRNVLYSAACKDDIVPLPFYKRVFFAFLLTDEMFAVAKTNQIQTGRFDYAYAVTAGLVMYAVWNLATFAGIISAHLLPDIENLGFDFAIVATFTSIMVPMITNRSLLIAVLVTGAAAYVFACLHFDNGLLVSVLMGMVTGTILSIAQGKADDAQNGAQQ